MTDSTGYCKRCVMWVVLDLSHGPAECDTYRNEGPANELLAQWVEVIHPTWFLA